VSLELSKANISMTEPKSSRKGPPQIEPSLMTAIFRRRECLEPSMPRDTWKADIKASLRGIARALHNFMGTVTEERLPKN